MREKRKREEREREREREKEREWRERERERERETKLFNKITLKAHSKTMYLSRLLFFERFDIFPYSKNLNAIQNEGIKMVLLLSKTIS